MKTKTYFCSDTHFNHPNILRYEPKRLDAIANFILEHNLKDKLFEELNSLRDVYNDEKEGWEAAFDFKYVYEEYLFEKASSDIDSGLEPDRIKNNISSLVHIFNDILSKQYILKDSTLDEEKRIINDNLQKALHKDIIKVILKYQTEMLIDNWNKVVKDDDLVYFLGDFGFGNDKELEEIGRRLKGHKTIIIGNHDGRKYDVDRTIKYNPTLVDHFKACGFERVEFNPIIIKGHFLLSHEPLFENLNGYNSIGHLFNIYGHIHSNPNYKTKTDNSLCACLDRWDYFPIEIEKYSRW